MKYYNYKKSKYIKRNCRQSNQVNQYIRYIYITQRVSKEELKKFLK